MTAKTKRWVFLVLLLSGLTPGLCQAKWEVWTNCTLLTDSYHYRDGDSFYIQRGPRSIYIVRLYGADTMETDNIVPERVKEQAEYFGISEKDVIKQGKEARKFTEKALKKQFTVYTEKEKAGGRSQQNRYYAFVQCDDGEYLSELLVAAGLARAYGRVVDRPDGKKEQAIYTHLRQLEKKAKRLKNGAWGAGGASNRLQFVFDKEKPDLDTWIGKTRKCPATIWAYSCKDPSKRVRTITYGSELTILKEEENDMVRVRVLINPKKAIEVLVRRSDIKL